MWNISSLPRKAVDRYGLRALQYGIDAASLAVAFTLAYLIRFDWVPSSEAVTLLVVQAPYVVGLELLTQYFARTHRLIWRFIALRDMFRLAYGVGLSTSVLLALRLLVPHHVFLYARIPFGIIAINAVLAFAALAGARVLRRLAYERTERLGRAIVTRPKRVVLIGAGRAGQLTAREIAERPDLGLKVVGFLDDDETKLHTRIQGIDVLGTTAAIPEVVETRAVDEVVISMVQVDGAVVRRVVEQCKAIPIPTKILPGLYEIIGGQVSVSRLRDVTIEDLLGREPVAFGAKTVRAFMQGKVAVVTGAGGSIGSEIARQLASLAPRRLVLIERFENALFEIHRELAARFVDLDLVPRIGDVTCRPRMTQIMNELGCDVVFHAAAHKHVPMMEWNPGEAVKNNVTGTRVMCDVAHEHGASHFVLISTDKAVNPESVMGATKRLAERYVQALAQQSKTAFLAVRFGNVLGSAGSVVPIFKQQIAAGGPITITHPDMRRYFMTIPEATELVLQTATLGRGGEVFILDMGRPVKIIDLARDLIALSGLRQDEVEIVFTGVRQGEKLFEVLSTADEQAEKTRHPKIFVGRIPTAELASVRRDIDLLMATAELGDAESIKDALAAAVPEYKRTTRAQGCATSQSVTARYLGDTPKVSEVFSLSPQHSPE